MILKPQTPLGASVNPLLHTNGPNVMHYWQYNSDDLPLNIFSWLWFVCKLVDPVRLSSRTSFSLEFELGLVSIYLHPLVWVICIYM